MSYLEVLDSERQRFDAKRGWSARTDELLPAVSLYKALDGDGQE